MKIVFRTLKKILFWSYDRGTWQYDLLCVLILAFIFLVPNWIFNGTGRSSPDHAVATQRVTKATSQPASASGLGGQSGKSTNGQPESPAERRKD